MVKRLLIIAALMGTSLLGQAVSIGDLVAAEDDPGLTVGTPPSLTEGP